MNDQYLIGKPSPRVIKHLPLIPKGGQVLDLACGNGRHAIWMAQQAYRVDAIDRDTQAISGLLKIDNINVCILDLETGDLKSAGCDLIFEEKISGGRWERPELHRLVGQLRKGDVLVVWKLDRLSRFLKDVLTLMEKIELASSGFNV